MLLAEHKNRKKVSRIVGATISVGLENLIKSIKIKSTLRIQIQNSLINRVQIQKFMDTTGSTSRLHPHSDCRGCDVPLKLGTKLVPIWAESVRSHR